MKMRILVKDSVPNGFVPVICAHAALACYLKFQDDNIVKEWLQHSFKKVVCSVSDEQFEKAKEYPDYVVMTESALEGKEVAIVFKPRNIWSNFFLHVKLFK